MKIPTPQYRCPLERLQPDVQDVDAIKQRGWRDITIRFACDRTTAWRRWQRALEIVATQLNCDGVRLPSKNVGNLG